MNLHKLLFPKKHNKLQELDEALTNTINDKIETDKKFMALGGISRSLPFIPSEYGFHESENYSEKIGTVTVYSKDGYHISNSGTSSGEEWLVFNEYLKLDGLPVRLENMRDAIIVLRALGMDISRESLTTKMPWAN